MLKLDVYSTRIDATIWVVVLSGILIITAILLYFLLDVSKQDLEKTTLSSVSLKEALTCLKNPKIMLALLLSFASHASYHPIILFVDILPLNSTYYIPHEALLWSIFVLAGAIVAPIFALFLLHFDLILVSLIASIIGSISFVDIFLISQMRVPPALLSIVLMGISQTALDIVSRSLVAQHVPQPFKNLFCGFFIFVGYMGTVTTIVFGTFIFTPYNNTLPFLVVSMIYLVTFLVCVFIFMITKLQSIYTNPFLKKNRNLLLCHTRL